DSAYSFGYDNASRLTSVDNAGAPAAVPHVLLTYGYDGLHNRTSLTDNLGGSITYGYDADHHLTAAVLGVSGAGQPGPPVPLTYDPRNRPQSIVRGTVGSPDTISTGFSYDGADRLSGITHTASRNPTPLATFTYHYDPANRVDSSTGPEGALTYTYDATNQLT